MKKYTLLVLALFLLPGTALADLSIDEKIEECKAKYTLRNFTLNSNAEYTGHDPRQFLIRRCITTARQAMRTQQQIERQQIRAAARYDRTAARVQQLRTENENYIQDAIRRQTVKISRFRSRTNVLDPDIFYEGRRSRRSIVRESEGLDRINAIRRNLRQQNLPDPCVSVRVLRYNSPCQVDGSSSQ